MNTNEAKELLARINYDLKQLAEYQDDGFDIVPHNQESTFENVILRTIATKAAAIVGSHDYLKRSIKGDGFLFERPDGRFGLQGTSTYFTAGSPIEIWDEDLGSYYPTSIEHDSKYYAVGYRSLDLEGLKARYR